MQKLVRALTSELNGYKTILDVGVGTGRFAKPMQDAGFQVVGVDISKKRIEKAKEKRVNNVLLGEARFLPFKDNVFDATISIHLLHLIKTWQDALREICRTTQGLMVSLYYARKDPVRQAFDALLRKYGYERHRQGKSEQELKDLINPVRSVFVSSYRTSADDRLINLAQDNSSNQWEIPKDISLKVAEELKGQFEGKVFAQELYVLEWKIEDLKAYTSKLAHEIIPAR